MSGGTLVSDDLGTNDYAAVCAGANLAVSGSHQAGQFFNVNNFIAWQCFFEFDTSAVVGTPAAAEIRITVGLSRADSGQNVDWNDADFYLAKYDNGGTLTTADWRDSIQLASLSGIVMTGVGVLDGDTVVFTVTDFSMINSGGLTRFILFTDRQALANSPDDGPGTIDFEYWDNLSAVLYVDGTPYGPPGATPTCTNPQFIVSQQLRAYLKLTP